MKTFFGMTAAVLLVVSLLFVSLPGTGRAAAGKVTLAEMVKIKKTADEAMKAATTQAEKAKTVGEKRLAKQLVKQAEINAEVAGDLLEAVKAGEEVSREEAEACAAIAKAVHEAAGALAAGNMGKAEGATGRIGELESSLPTAANARAEMQRAAGADKAGKNQTVTADDMNKKGKPVVLPTAANAGVDFKTKEANLAVPIGPVIKCIKWAAPIIIEKCIEWGLSCKFKEKKECQKLASPSSIVTEHCTITLQPDCQPKCIQYERKPDGSERICIEFKEVK